MKKSRSVAAVTKIAGTYAGNAKKQIKQLNLLKVKNNSNQSQLLIQRLY